MHLDEIDCDACSDFTKRTEVKYNDHAFHKNHHVLYSQLYPDTYFIATYTYDMFTRSSI